MFTTKDGKYYKLSKIKTPTGVCSYCIHPRIVERRAWGGPTLTLSPPNRGTNAFENLNFFIFIDHPFCKRDPNVYPL